jgi:ERCC4-type nuclease
MKNKNYESIDNFNYLNKFTYNQLRQKISKNNKILKQVYVDLENLKTIIKIGEHENSMIRTYIKYKYDDKNRGLSHGRNKKN